MVEINENDVKIAHEKGCADVKKTLEILFPSVFTKPFPKVMRRDDGLIIFALSMDKAWVIKSHKGGTGTPWNPGEEIKPNQSTAFTFADYNF